MEGQRRVIQRMVRDGRYCLDVLTELAEARASLRDVERALLRAQLALGRIVKARDACDQERRIATILDV